ncbi:lipase family protein [Lactococcus carnosus]|uniref:Fungal lipase-type domain-containing protein n=1 Tax=Pseudolactococcus carnosus TaxID=2749961 RepID=A0ABT0AS69_9LACT|nr:hypothetical protein [Lactococcus carnosus]SCA91349.1 hypothetical protein (containing a Lipase 3 domain) [Lactococcus piscium]MCJ1988081.1 hypothetical protein [Lactococcus carnosus]MCJ1989558.1 hypothetical protein [Lactococcus carnosus]MCJ2004966.1 hypothetical protein [Lactococcus carnosus]QDJ26497.1 hypothetical protein BHS00_08025 [Lactococcus carnosus]
MKEKEIIILVVRGTNGTVKEWSSNFDVGADTSDYWDQANPSWINKANHKGFDVTKNRLKAKVDAYVKQYVTAPASDQIYYVTGHSRGAALGNLFAKDLIDSYSSSKVFSYTFATPNNTTSSSAASSKYKGLFSILNTDDIVPQMPLKNWGFTNYGQIREVSVAEKYEKILNFENGRSGTFEWLTGHDYNNDGGTKRTLNAFSKVANGREALYQKDYDNNSEFRKKLQTGNMGSYVYMSISFETYTKNYVKDKGNRIIRYTYTSDGTKTYQTPAFLMQDLAYLASAGNYEKVYDEEYLSIPNVNAIKHLRLGNDVAVKYKAAKTSFIQTSGGGGKMPIYGGIAHPHLPQTYYLIARNNFVPLS